MSTVSASGPASSHCGFDIFPRLEPNESNRDAYSRFKFQIDEFHVHEYDEKGITIKTTGPIAIANGACDYFWFNAGNCPFVPEKGDYCEYFLRFCGRGSEEPYIQRVYEIAKQYFGTRVRYWHEPEECGLRRKVVDSIVGMKLVLHGRRSVIWETWPGRFVLEEGGESKGGVREHGTDHSCVFTTNAYNRTRERYHLPCSSRP
jgi:hypothetical protein